MSSTDQHIMRHGSRIMAISVFIIIIISSYKNWMHFFAIACSIFNSYILKESVSPVESTVAVDKYAYPEPVPFRAVAAPSSDNSFSLDVTIAKLVFNKLHSYLNESKSRAHETKEFYVWLNTYAHQLLLVDGIAGSDRFVFDRGHDHLISLYHVHITNGTIEEYYLQREISKLQNLQKEIPFKIIVAPPLDYNGIPSDCSEGEKSYQPFFKKRYEFVQNTLRTLPSSIGRVNLYDIMRSEGKSLNEMLLRTDHHWRPETGFWAFTHIATYLRDNYDLEFSDSLLHTSNYHFKTYPNALKGTHGGQIGITLDQYDDFTIITPKFETDYKLEFTTSNHTIRGAHQDVFLANSSHSLDDEHPLLLYSIYMGGDYPFIKIKNYKASNNVRALVVRDSFSCVTLPFLASLFSETYVYDRRFEQQSLEAYVKMYQPDLVIFTLRFPPFLKFHDN